MGNDQEYSNTTERLAGAVVPSFGTSRQKDRNTM
jgi:hypothetical protein